MDKNEFSQIMAGIHGAYPGERITEEKKTVMLWWNMLKDMPYREVARNLTEHIKTCKYPPTIAELRKDKPAGFKNFTGRIYNMDKLELALLGVQKAAICEVKE